MVDIYDVSTNTWSTAKLSEARTALTAVSGANKIFFAGGFGSGVSSTIDIYYVNANTWGTAELTVARAGLAAAVSGDKILIGGGYSGTGFSSLVDVFTLTN